MELPSRCTVQCDGLFSFRQLKSVTKLRVFLRDFEFADGSALDADIL